MTDPEPTPPCASCGEEAEPWPFACPECERVHHARCWRTRGGCAACDCRTHAPKQETPGPPPARPSLLRIAYLRLVARVRERSGIPLGPRGFAAAALGAILLAVVLGLGAITLLR